MAWPFDQLNEILKPLQTAVQTAQQAVIQATSPSFGGGGAGGRSDLDATLTEQQKIQIEQERLRQEQALLEQQRLQQQQLQQQQLQQTQLQKILGQLQATTPQTQQTPPETTPPPPSGPQYAPVVLTATGDVDADATVLCSGDYAPMDRYWAALRVDSWIRNTFNLIQKISLWDSQGYDVSSVKNLFEGAAGWQDMLARASSDKSKVTELCSLWPKLISAVQNLPLKQAAAVPPDLEKIFARGIAIIMPNSVIEGTRTNVKVFITRHISLGQGQGEPTVTITAGGQKIAEVQTVNRTADLMIDIPTSAKYYKICASSSIGGQDCKTVKVMKEVPNIAELVAAENNLLEALKAATSSRNIIGTTPVSVTPPTDLGLPEIDLPEIPSGAIVDIPGITMPEKATEPIQIYIDGKPYGSPPLSVTIPAGKHIVTASLKGFTEINKTIRVTDGTRVVIPEIVFG